MLSNHLNIEQLSLWNIAIVSIAFFIWKLDCHAAITWS